MNINKPCSRFFKAIKKNPDRNVFDTSQLGYPRTIRFFYTLDPKFRV